MKLLTSIFSFFPMLLGSIVAVEQNIQAPGATKKQIVLSSIDAVAQMGEAVPIPMVAMISTMIDVIVQALNRTGVFHHAATAATTQDAGASVAAVPTA
ncbi:MAG: hypothetical protein NVS1B11_36680 [Terriglobales bacterium]